MCHLKLETQIKKNICIYLYKAANSFIRSQLTRNV